MSLTTITFSNSTLLKNTQALVFDTSGNLYAGNNGIGGGGSSIVKIDASGNATLLASKTGTNFAGMYYLNGFLYVCGYNFNVYKINVTSGVITTFANLFTVDTSSITGVAGTTGVLSLVGITYISPYFYVTGSVMEDSSPVIMRLNETTAAASVVVSKSADNISYFIAPRGITVDASNNLHVADNGSNSILKFNNSGTFISKCILPDIGVTNVVLYNNYYYICNVNNDSYKVSLDGTVVSSQYAIGGGGGNIFVYGGMIFDTAGALYTSNVLLTSGVYSSLIKKTYIPTVFACFNEGSLILTDKGYIPVQDLRKGDLIKTEKNDFIPIDLIGFREIYHHATETRIKEQLYKCSKEEYPQLIEDLILTGCHSILIEDFSSKEEREYVKKMNGNIYRTGGKFRLPAYLDNRSSVYEVAGNYTIYHLALENDADYLNYGIYANGLLVETSSKRCLQDRFNMI